MIELRWLKFENHRVNRDGTSYDFMDKRLQYRWAVMLHDEAVWSDWQDVPTVMQQQLETTNG